MINVLFLHFFNKDKKLPTFFRLKQAHTKPTTTIMQAHDINQMITNNMAQHGSVQNENLLAVAPVLQDQIDNGHESTGPLVLIGYLASKPVYRTTHTVAHRKSDFLIIKSLPKEFHFIDMEGYWPGAYRIHWPPLFTNIWLPECQHMQLDVTIRTEVGIV